MTYVYQAERPRLFTDDGQRTLLKVRDNVNRLLNEAGAVTLERAIFKISGDSWVLCACLDRLVELGEIVEVEPDVPKWGQDRVFIRGRQ